MSPRFPRLALVAALGATAALSAPQAASAQSLERCGDAIRVQPGNTLNQIAQYCGTTVAALMAANPQIVSPNVIHVGQVIRMPRRGDVQRPRPPLAQPSPPPTTGACGSRVTVRPGDTLFRIAVRCRTSVASLLRANPQIRDPRQIRVGQSIRLPGAVMPPSAERPRRPGPTPPSVPAAMQFTGTVTSEGTECPTVRGDDGRLYTLIGDYGRVRPGDRVEISGRAAELSICMQGTTVDVRRLVQLRGPAEPPPGLEITGTLTREGVSCPALRGDDGRLYTLAGDIRGFQPGDRVQVQGERAGMSICMQGTTIELRRIRAAR